MVRLILERDEEINAVTDGIEACYLFVNSSAKYYYCNKNAKVLQEGKCWRNYLHVKLLTSADTKPIEVTAYSSDSRPTKAEQPSQSSRDSHESGCKLYVEMLLYWGSMLVDAWWPKGWLPLHGDEYQGFNNHYNEHISQGKESL